MITAPALGLCKIGYSSNVDDRLKHLNYVCPVDLELHKTRRGGFKTEHAIHAAVAVHRVKFEWFSFIPEVVNVFDSAPTLDVDTVYSLQKQVSLVETAKSERRPRVRYSLGPVIDWTFHDIREQQG